MAAPSTLNSTLNYVVSGMTCSHCVNAVASEIRTVSGVDDVSIDLETKTVVVTGEELDDSAIRCAIVEAGYEASA